MVTLYFPGAKPENEYTPCALVVCDGSFWPVSILVTVTVAPGITPPELSTTTPDKRPLDGASGWGGDCFGPAAARGIIRATTRAPNNVRTRFDMTAPWPPKPPGEAALCLERSCREFLLARYLTTRLSVIWLW